MTNALRRRVLIPVQDELLNCVPQALTRLRYLFPDLEISFSESGLEFYSESDEVPPGIQKEAQYQLYREKVFQETLPLRLDLYKMLSS